MGAERDEHTDTGPEAPTGRHAAKDGDAVHPLIDLSRDPNPGRPDHAKPDAEG
ncbi:hypothetical protein [Actinokineospora bangkokensis]|uniref:hypothetical protein n=1 Tax=Actinokineospora bangkokensis TaxID=1193682 RepID=UPI000AEA653D|nr:hypothetical protein [Actinokineospora bangkokensis]